jgi:excisionase family DNA binding protein
MSAGPINIRLYSISEAAKEMHIGKTQLYMLINEGRLGTVKIGKQRKVSHMELIRFIRENTVSFSNTVTNRDIQNYLSKKTKWKMKKTETDKFIKSLKGEN